MPITDLATKNNVIFSLVIIIITGLIIYYIYDYIRKLIHNAHNEPILIKGFKNAKAPLTFASKDLLPAHNAYDGTYMIWLNVNDTNWNSDKSKHIFNKGNDVSVTMSAKYNNIEVIVKQEDGDIISIKIQNIPLQRWFHLVVANTKQSCDIYIDGELYTSRVINGSIKSHSNSDLSITQNGGFGGLISHLRYYNRVVLPKEIKKIYSNGPNPYTILDLSKLVKKLTPKLTGDLKIGDWSAKDFITGQYNDIKNDIVTPLVDGTANALGDVDNAVDNIAGDAQTTTGEQGIDVTWGYGPGKTPTCFQKCDGAAAPLAKLTQHVTDIMAGKPPTRDKFKADAIEACNVLKSCPGACADVTEAGTPVGNSGEASIKEDVVKMCQTMGIII